MVCTLCMLQLHFPTKVQIFFSARLNFLRTESKVGKTDVFCILPLLSPWCPLALLFSLLLEFSLVSPHALYWHRVHPVAYFWGIFYVLCHSSHLHACVVVCWHPCPWVSLSVGLVVLSVDSSMSVLSVVFSQLCSTKIGSPLSPVSNCSLSWSELFCPG